MSEAKRQQLKEKIAAAEARNRAKQDPSLMDRAGAKATEAKDQLTTFAKEHPIALVAGGLAVGVLVSAMFKRSPTRKLARKVSNEASGLATIGAEMAMAYAQQAMAAAEDARKLGAEKLGDLGDSIGDRTRSLKREAAYIADEASDNARITKRDTAKAITRAIRNRLH